MPELSSAAKLQSGLNQEKEWLSGGLFFLLLAVALFVAFPKVVLGLETFIYRDFGSICYPQLFYQRESLLQGELPFWNPYNFCGIPFMAQWGTWYPVYFLHALLPMPWSVNFFHLLHLVWAGGGMYWLVRRWGAGAFAAAFAGFAYVFNGVTLSCLMWPGYIAFLAWSPWVMGCTMAAWRSGGRWLPLAALTGALQVLACAPELLVLFWGLLEVLWFIEVARGGISFWPSLGRLAAVVILVAGLTMIQMLPFFDLLANSQRDLNFGGNKWAMPAWGWANLLVPLFHCYQSPHGPWFQPGQELVCSYYLGAGVLVLAIAAVFASRNLVASILALVALFCWVMALGSHGVLFDWVRNVLPWIGIARYPVKFALFPVFLVPLLASLMVDRASLSISRNGRRLLTFLTGAALLMMIAILWVGRSHPFPRDQWQVTAQNTLVRALVAVFIVGGIVWLSKVTASKARAVLQAGVLVLLPLDAFTHNPLIFPTLPVSDVAPGLWATTMKQPSPNLGEGRVMSSPSAELYLKSHGSTNLALDFTGRRLAERNSLNLLDRVPKVAGGGMILRLSWFDQLENYLYSTNGSVCGQGLLDFLSVAWTSSPESPVLWIARTNYLPVVTAGQRPAFATDDQALRSVTADQFEPREVVYLNESARSSVSVTNRTNCKVLAVLVSAHTIEAEIEAAEPSLVVLSQSFYHLWEAFVDGRSTPLLRANLAFQALQVPAGRHHVMLVYRDRYITVGALISVLALGGLLWIWIASIRASRYD